MVRHSSSSLWAGLTLVALVSLLVPGFHGATGSLLAAAPQRTAGATLQGTVVLGSKLTSHGRRFSLYPDASRPLIESSSGPGGEEIGNVVVYLVSAPSLAGPPPAAPAPVIRQEKEAFVPHVLPVV